MNKESKTEIASAPEKTHQKLPPSQSIFRPESSPPEIPRHSDYLGKTMNRIDPVTGEREPPVGYSALVPKAARTAETFEEKERLRTEKSNKSPDNTKGIMG